MILVNENYIPTIGLEVHIQLSTNTKLFCSDSTHFKAEPNTQISEVSLAYPGSMPVMNEKVIRYAIKLGLACGSEISRYMIFDRKNYYYPDLPKGYQITQDNSPVCIGGKIPIILNNKTLEIKLNRIHIEEDAGKSIHDEKGDNSYIDFNRAGVVLLEMVTEPVIHSSQEASRFLQQVRRLVRFLGIGDGNMEEGSLRCDANVSVAQKGSEFLGNKVEIKNLNSFKFVQKAIDFEIQRQVQLLEKSEPIESETRLYDSDKNLTKGMRSKETLNDYRYFPDPDLSPVTVSDLLLEDLKAEMEIVPWELEERLAEISDLNDQDRKIISNSLGTWHYFKDLTDRGINPKVAANWISGPIRTILNQEKLEISDFPVSPESLAILVTAIEKKVLTYKIASGEILDMLFAQKGRGVKSVIEEFSEHGKGTNQDLEDLVRQVVMANPEEFRSLKQGKKKLVGMFMGLIMKETGGKADPNLAREILMKIELD